MAADHIVSAHIEPILPAGAVICSDGFGNLFDDRPMS
jgi:hypothetical protein